MTKAIYTLLIATALTGSAVDATQHPSRPKTPSPTTSPTNRTALTKDNNSICPDTLDYKQLQQIQGGTLVLAGWKFNLHSSKAAFDSMMPNKMEGISKLTRKANITTGLAKGRAIIPEIQGNILKCVYNYSTITGKTVEFAITSEHEAHKKELKGLTEAILGSSTGG